MTDAALADRPIHVPADRVIDFDMFAPEGGKEDIHEAWRRLQQPGVPDLVWTPRNGGHWIATRAKQVREVFSDHKRFSSRVFLLPKASGEQWSVLPGSLDPPQHSPFRALITPMFTPAAVMGMERLIRDIVVELIEGFRLKGECNFNADYGEIFPLKVFMMLVQLPFADAPRLKKVVDELLRPTGAMTFAEANQQLVDYLLPHIDARIGKDGDDLLSRIINGEVKGRSITREEALNMSISVLAAGLDTVANFAAFAMLFLARNEDKRHELIAHPDRIPTAVEELLRRFPVAMAAREVRQEIEFAGVHLKAGDMVLASGPLSGLDDRLNERPTEVDFERENIKHTTFGFGSHHCAGAHLARLEMRVTLEEWLARIPEFSVPATAKVTYTGGHVCVVDELPLEWDPATTVDVA